VIVWLSKILTRPIRESSGSQKFRSQLPSITVIEKSKQGDFCQEGVLQFEIHVYKPKLVAGEFNFDWGRGPYGARAPAPGW
jgi:hypothetical protein